MCILPFVAADTNDTVTPPFPIDKDGNFMPENLFPHIDGIGGEYDNV